MRTEKHYSSWTAAAAVAVIAVFMICLLTVTAQASDATVTSGSEASVTSAVYTDDILRQADIAVGENDEIIRTDSEGVVSLTIVRAFDVRIEYHGEVFTVKRTSGTVGDAIEAAGITLTDTEQATPGVDTELYSRTTVRIMSDSNTTVTVDGTTNSYKVTGTVAEVLSDLGITLSEHDTVNYDLDKEVTDGMDIVVKRVEYREETKTEPIDYHFTSQETSSLVSGTSKIKQYGIEGERTIVSRNKYVDGKLTESKELSNKITAEPVDQIKLIGTGVNYSSYSKPQSSSSSSNKVTASSSSGGGTLTDASGKKVSYTNVLTGTGTAYYADANARTATGVKVFKGGVAVNPNIIPYGTKMYIVSSDGSVVYGYATAVDTGGALMSGTCLVDLFYPTYGECVSFGRRTVQVYILG